MQELDTHQEAAAKAPLGSSLIVAGAGTGKTTTLTARIAFLIAEKGIPAESIMAVTFTNKAARELKERVEQKIGTAAEGLRLGTFHGLSGRIVRKHARSAGLQSPAFSIADEDDAKALMKIAAQTPGAYGPFAPDPALGEKEIAAEKKAWEAGLRDFVQKAVRQVSLWKGWGLTQAEAADQTRPSRTPGEERLAAAYSAYQYELESRNMADFGDLILRAVVMFRSLPDILDEEAGAVRHLLVDEAQDANPIQVEWARLLSSVHGGLTVVGDDDQNIYGFQGGFPGAMQEMAGPSAKAFRLVTNRRCTEEILEPANLAVSYNRRKEPKVLSSGRSGAQVRATGHATEINEAAWISARVKEIVDGGTPPESIALLFRAAHVIPPYEEALARKGIPSIVTSGQSLLEKEEVKDVLAMVKMAMNPYDDLSFQRLAVRPSKGLGTAAIEVLTNFSRNKSVPFHEACIAAASGASGQVMRKDAKAGASQLGKALGMLAEEGEWLRHTYDIISVGLRETGYMEWLQKQEKHEARVAAVEAIHRLSESYEDASEFLHEVALLTDGETHQRDLRGKVRLSTIHSVKGLEFDHVFCPAFDEGVMPNPRAVDEGRKGKPGDVWNGPHGGGIEEERRLAHVAFTRARHGLDVSFSWRRGAPGRKAKNGGPSCFIEECELKWTDVGSATTAELGRVKKKRRPGRLGYDR